MTQCSVSGDYAWGREGLDTIVTQLLNQMDNAGLLNSQKQLNFNSETKSSRSTATRSRQNRWNTEMWNRSGSSRFEASVQRVLGWFSVERGRASTPMFGKTLSNDPSRSTCNYIFHFLSARLPWIMHFTVAEASRNMSYLPKVVSAGRRKQCKCRASCKSAA